MIFHEGPLAGSFVLDLEPRHDVRGFFARTWCQEEFHAFSSGLKIICLIYNSFSNL